MEISTETKNNSKDLSQMLIPYDDPDGFDYIMNECWDHIPPEDRFGEFYAFLQLLPLY